MIYDYLDHKDTQGHNRKTHKDLHKTTQDITDTQDHSTRQNRRLTHEQMLTTCQSKTDETFTTLFGLVYNHPIFHVSQYFAATTHKVHINIEYTHNTHI